MLTKKELIEIKQYLLKSKKPLFYFDDDPDGLSSYLILKRYIKRGKGVVVKSAPIVNVTWLRKAQEYNPDRIFILDKPEITQEFIDKAKKPIIWIDHHYPIKLEGVKYYNPRVHDKDSYLPASYLCYKVINKYLWIAMIGTVGDWFLPEFTKNFCKEYPNLLSETIKDPGEASYNSKLGILIKIFAFILKGKSSEVNKSIKLLEEINEPYELLEHKTTRSKYLYEKFEKVNKIYQSLLNNAVTSIKDDFLIFIYPSTKISLTGGLANELSYLYPDKLVLIGREKGDEVRLSLRCRKKPVLPILQESLKGIQGYGGGHLSAVGSCIKKQDLELFIKKLKDNYKNDEN